MDRVNVSFDLPEFVGVGSLPALFGALVCIVIGDVMDVRIWTGLIVGV